MALHYFLKCKLSFLPNMSFQLLMAMEHLLSLPFPHSSSWSFLFDICYFFAFHFPGAHSYKVNLTIFLNFFAVPLHPAKPVISIAGTKSPSSFDPAVEDGADPCTLMKTVSELSSCVVWFSCSWGLSGTCNDANSSLQKGPGWMGEFCLSRKHYQFS